MNFKKIKLKKFNQQKKEEKNHYVKYVKME